MAYSVFSIFLVSLFYKGQLLQEKSIDFLGNIKPAKERPFVCSICFKTFTHKHHLKGHINIHAGVKPFQCSVCSKQFTDQSNCKRHCLTHFPNNE